MGLFCTKYFFFNYKKDNFLDRHHKLQWILNLITFGFFFLLIVLILKYGLEKYQKYIYFFVFYSKVTTLNYYWNKNKKKLKIQTLIFNLI